MSDLRETPEPAVAGDRVAFAHAVLECSPDCLKVLDVEGNVLFFNSNGLCAMEIDDIAQVAGQYWPSFWPPETSALAQNAIKDALAGRVGAFEGFCPTAKGTPKWWDVSVTAVPNPGHTIERLIVLSRDVTSRRAEDERKTALAAELAHRINNTLAVVMAIAGQTKRASENIDAFYNAFSSRLRAMADATTAVIADDWAGAHMRTLATTQLKTFLVGGQNRIALDGPEVLVPRDMAQALALALNELATNAAKYGALSNAHGRVALVWKLSSERDAVSLEWRESGGPVVVKPSRTGLGSALITGGIAGADVTLAFEPSGLVCTMKLPL